MAVAIASAAVRATEGSWIDAASLDLVHFHEKSGDVNSMDVDTTSPNGGTTYSSASSSFAHAVSSSDTDPTTDSAVPADALSNGEIRVIPRVVDPDTGKVVRKQKRIDPTTNKVIYRRKLVDPVLRPATRVADPQSRLLTNEVCKIMAGIAATRKVDGTEETDVLPISSTGSTQSDQPSVAAARSSAPSSAPDPFIADAPIDASVLDKAEASICYGNHASAESTLQVPPLTHVDLFYQLREDPMDTTS